MLPPQLFRATSLAPRKASSLPSEKKLNGHRRKDVNDLVQNSGMPGLPVSALQETQTSSVARPAALSDKSQRAAIICGCLVAFAYSANYTNHAPLAPALMREFGFDQALAGFLTTGIFATHAAIQMPGGHLVDRLGSRRVVLCALAWVALGNLGMAFAGAYWQLLLCKIFTGIGTGVC